MPLSLVPLSSATLGAEAQREGGEVGRLGSGKREAAAAAWAGYFVHSFTNGEWRMVDGWMDFELQAPLFWCPPFGIPLFGDLSSRKGGYTGTSLLCC